ncbi:HPF/RaiA family ribosome-associated protein [Cryomorpha ignava]|uniref:HPF/RaiA family ribosome-associated protein n=1 Tax=Cryomorpha ignava TaxID=101383 RepID=A0A7K3WLP8_9FLAO|nr:HPF/RaiA family ribosome-associated protein [Cryomorpha ignava]NEN22569.1 HPF/RaiA family ribosome-associated protein [Cryomorpha ignava]
MTIQFNTDNNITGSEEFQEKISERLTHSLKKYGDKITRLEVHISDENGSKFGENDKRCMLEARVADLRPVAVTSFDNTIDQSVAGAISKLTALLDTTFGKMEKH